jgi:hypothetical protein
MAPVALGTAEAGAGVPRLRYFDVVSAVVITFILGVTVIQRWHAYRLFDKCFSVVTLLILLTFPWGAIRMEKRGQKLEIWHAYLLVLLATALFR